MRQDKLQRNREDRKKLIDYYLTFVKEAANNGQSQCILSFDDFCNQPFVESDIEEAYNNNRNVTFIESVIKLVCDTCGFR